MDVNLNRDGDCVCSSCYWAVVCTDRVLECDYYTPADIDRFLEKDMVRRRRGLFEREWLEYAFDYADRSADD